MIPLEKKTAQSDQISFLYHALKQAQESVRSFDTKAQIMGIGFIWSLNLVPELGGWGEGAQDISPISIIVAWVLIIIPIILFGSVLYPSRKVAPNIVKDKELIKGLYHIDDHEVQGVKEYVHKLTDSKILDELTYELLKVSSLRDLKRKRFLAGLIAASCSFTILFATQLLFAI